MQGLNANHAPQISLLRDIDDQLSDAWSSVYKLQDLSHHYDHRNDVNEDYDEEDLYFASKIERIHLSFCVLIESLGYSRLLKSFKSGYKIYADKPTACNTSRDGDYYNKTLGYFWNFHKTISSMVNPATIETDEQKQRAMLEVILKNTPKIVLDRHSTPNSESDVRNCVYDLLIHVFPDTKREVPIAQVSGTYKADIAIHPIKTAIEFKYAVTPEEAKKVIGGFYEDMHVYAGSEDWKHFYAVLYMAKPFFTTEQIQAEFGHVGADRNWSPILVHGEGTRNRSKAKLPPKPRKKASDVP
ncbi:hypothetical protein LRQ05_16365 [Pseudomonas bubulae]|uniref:PD-(D/E)XK nuclease domain-containing protein n=1 Tax=Pseudomonas bubulae TaxID=2316085 RepID=UPI001F49087B|nr:hypothetical protein [Pseudomonas bubulae]MCF3194403.1 hypothetical protein [Pseudomonas bubulae]